MLRPVAGSHIHVNQSEFDVAFEVLVTRQDDVTPSLKEAKMTRD